MDGKVQKEAGELQRKLELNLENSGSLAIRTDRASEYLAETVALTIRFHAFYRECAIS